TEKPSHPTAEEEAITETPDSTSSSAADERARDDKGRFVKREGDTAADTRRVEEGKAAAEKAEAPKPGPVGEPPAQSQPPLVADRAAPKPPPSWRAAAREHWGKLPAEVQQEALRREAETTRVLNESNQARQHFEAYSQRVRPYEDFLRQ